jgi:phosphatidylglycerophosphatase A
MGFSFNRFFVTAAGIGYIPVAPGTCAAFVSAMIWYFTFHNFEGSIFWQVCAAMLITVAGIYFSGRIISEWGKDPSKVVIDEVAGMAITLLLIPPSIINYAIGFLLFRFFDIVKPLGIRNMENKKNGWGIMLDDILAGIYSNLFLRFLISFGLW